MRKIILVATSLLLFACGGKSTDDLIKEENITELKNRKSDIQAELAKIDAVLNKGGKAEESEALVSVLTL